ncbi:MAG: PHB depolymerase family esterase [Steroidobacteraceae bacterium]|jgi:poly(hydroxyalkanoate) depolymerase family esterase
MSYEIHTPAAAGREPRALLVMLHGCQQTPADFAAGTRMSGLAAARGVLTVYPAQAAAANPLGCWNWFAAKDQARDGGEPALIAGIAREVAADHRIDPRHIFVAGMSAGGAMAVILGATYPDLFAAVGVHSGLPYGAAHDSASALGAMRGAGARPPASRPPASRALPTIVFHGDEDTTVDISNGAAIVDDAVSGAQRAAGPLQSMVRDHTSPGGRDYTTTVYRRPDAPALVEYWVVHGAAHAWSGGSPAGSFTDAAGPDASAEMLRFFMAQIHAEPRLAYA